MPDIAVIDYGMGNLRSVAKAPPSSRLSAPSW
jgi:imidazoleglycerol phosphate synthase glutamine amidotransferase subunit HisH